MTRRVCLYLVGSLVLVSLAGCGRGFFQTVEREAWRTEAESACLKSGAIRESASLVRVEPINGPGICGAEYPLKVAALGGSALGFANDMRPPGGIPNAPNQPRWPVNTQPRYQSPAIPDERGYLPANGPATNGPISLHAPGVSEDDAAFDPRHARDPADDRLYRNSPRMGTSNVPNYGGPAGRISPVDQYQQPHRMGPSRGEGIAAIGPVTIKPTATLACPVVSALDRWIVESIQPSAMRWFGQPVAEIRQISAYSCRGMNGNRNARISEHAFGNALDIASFTLADGRRISVKDGWRGLPEEQGFLRDVQGAACQQFSTVLAPGSNIYHYDHIHVDLMRRSKGRVICQPAAVSGEAIAARASNGRYAGRDAGVTGSIGKRRISSAAKSSDDDWIEDESNIRDNGR